MREHAHYLRVFCRERENRGLTGGEGGIRTLGTGCPVPQTISIEQVRIDLARRFLEFWLIAVCSRTESRDYGL